MTRRTDSGDQLAFDIDGMLHEAEVAAAPPWAGPAPLHFTVDYHRPADLKAAWEHWNFLHARDRPRVDRHIWRPGSPIDPHGEVGGHRLVSFTADLRCMPWEHKYVDGERVRCSCVGDLMCQGICEPCEWHVIGSEAQVVESWHDHAWPGWRELPVMPHMARVRDQSGRFTKPALAWIEEHFPAEWQIPGAPIITERQLHGTRHVPDYSPWGGYDISSTALGLPAVDPNAPPLAPPAARAKGKARRTAARDTPSP